MKNAIYLNLDFFFLIENLSKKLKKNSKIRLRDTDLGWAEHPRFKKKFPDYENSVLLSSIIYDTIFVYEDLYDRIRNTINMN